MDRGLAPLGLRGLSRHFSLGAIAGRHGEADRHRALGRTPVDAPLASLPAGIERAHLVPLCVKGVGSAPLSVRRRLSPSRHPMQLGVKPRAWASLWTVWGK